LSGVDLSESAVALPRPFPPKVPRCLNGLGQHEAERGELAIVRYFLVGAF
jgi:hypothetical protein